MTNKKDESKSEKRKKDVPEYKLKAVSEIAEKMKKSRTILIASTKGLPSSQFHEIKKNMRDKAEIRVAKKSIILRAISAVQSNSVDALAKHITSDIAIFLSQLDAFELSALLTDNMSPAKANAKDIAPEDITVEPGPTNLVPGPAISELSSVGLKVAVEGGKLAIKQGATIVHKGEAIKENVASVLAKLDIKPMKVGFEPLVAYDSQADKIYAGIKIDKKKVLEELRDSIKKSLALSVNRGYTTKETIILILSKSVREEKIIESLIAKVSSTTSTEAAQIHDTEIKEGS